MCTYTRTCTHIFTHIRVCTHLLRKRRCGEDTGKSALRYTHALRTSKQAYPALLCRNAFCCDCPPGRSARSAAVRQAGRGHSDDPANCWLDPRRHSNTLILTPQFSPSSTCLAVVVLASQRSSSPGKIPRHDKGVANTTHWAVTTLSGTGSVPRATGHE